MNDRMIEKMNDWGEWIGILGAVILLISALVLFFNEFAALIILPIGFFIMIIGILLWGTATSRRSRELQIFFHGQR